MKGFVAGDRSVWVALAVVGVATFVALLQPISSFDTPWHMATGEWILAHHQLPDVDVFGYSYLGMPWSNHSAGFQIVLAAFVRAFGVAGATLLPALLLAGFTAFTTAVVHARTQFAVSAVAAVILLVTVACHHAIVARPQIVNFMALGVALVAASRTLRAPSPKVSTSVLLLHLLWIPCHGSHPMLPALFAFVALFALAHRAYRAAAHAAAVATLTSILSICLDPAVLSVFHHHATSSFARDSLGEWQTLSLSRLLSTNLGWVLVVTFGLSIAGTWIRIRKDPHDLLVRFESVALWTATALLVFGVVRVVPLYLLGLAPLWGVGAFAAMGAVVRKTPQKLNIRLGLARAGFAALCAAITIMLLASGGRQPGFGFDPQRFPVASVAALKKNPPAGRIFNAYNFGGYLIWQRIPVLVDGRAQTLYPDTFLANFAASYEDPAVFAALVTKWEIDHVLLPKDSRKSAALLRSLSKDPRWTIRAQDQASVLLVRTTPDESDGR